MKLLRSLFFALLSGLLFCQGAWAVEYKVAVRAHHGIDVAIQLWQSTIDFLNENIPEHAFVLLPVVSLDDLVILAGEVKYDFVLTNPSNYVEIEERFDARALLTLNNKRADTAQSLFGGVIFTHVSNLDILSIKDLKGKSLMAVSEPAFGGWRVAWLEMLEQGFNPKSGLKLLTYAKSRAQPEVAYAVRDRKVDVGVVRTDLLERLEKEGKIDMRYFRIINNKEIKSFPFFLSTKLYPEWAFAALKHVPVEHGQQVTEVLMTMKRHHQAALAGKYVGWIAPLDYQSVRKLMRRLKVGPYGQQ